MTNPIITVQAPNPAEVAKTSKAHADAVNLLKRRNSDLAESEALVQNIKAEWARGVDKHSALDLLSAQAEQERSKLLIRHAELTRRAAENSLVNDDTGLAEAFAAFAASGIPCGSIIVTTAAPKASDLSAKAVLPVLVLVQAKPSVSAFGPSVIGGEIRAVLFRAATHRELDVTNAVIAAEREDWSLTAEADGLGTQAEGTQLIEDSFSITVTQAFAPIPTVASLVEGSEDFTRLYAERLARKAAAALQRHDAPAVGGRVGSGDASAVSETVHGSGEVGKIESVKVRDGIREATVLVPLVGKPVDPREDPDRIVAQFSRTIREQVSVANPYYGRCVSAEIASVKPMPLGPNRPASGRVVTARMVFKSKVLIATD